MYLHLPLLLFLLAHATQSEANVLARSSESIVRVATRAHRRAVKGSAGLARDLRLSFRGILADTQQPAAISNSRIYCVSSSGFSSGGNGSEIANGGTTSVGFEPISTNVPFSGSSSGSSASSTSKLTGTTGTGTATGSGSKPTSSAGATSSPWKIVQSYQGSSFFNGWDFFTESDPTHGTVNYVDQNTAQSANLTSINGAGHAIMSVETTPTVASVRQSVRITTQFTYTGGLVIMDSVHMPTGCGTWPAFWSNGPNWPAGGEIDIVEGVNDYTNNQATIHTNPGCSMPSSSSSALNITGDVVSTTDCAAAETGNAGCGIRSADTKSYGATFNSNNGGVYAMMWTNDGISVYFFERNSIPSDITNNAPLPDGWGQPMAFWPASTCSPFQFFNSHSAIFDTTLCGDWASGVWGSAGVPGQAQSCAQITGVPTCQQFVQQNGAAFAQAYWEVKYVQIYQTS
ncbi:hypothetical protein PHLCEN_2v970 [Hermanssonia centrifuga]|uniref:GH16 domain-containing protein n=1 Tax=Hermanssonia centrifuga TaxID=98765 RepID=A0A2R6S4Q5_9APHY|nr:hypothetical protein PHLCEN_2v970 [Hermanssonia centrifuga]